jgi:hypothetical protein
MPHSPEAREALQHHAELPVEPEIELPVERELKAAQPGSLALEAERLTHPFVAGESPESSSAVPFDDNLDWDLSSPPPTTTPDDSSRLPKEEPFARDPVVPKDSMPLLRRKTNPAIERAGVYSIPAEQLPVEEVVLVRIPGSPQRREG